MLAYIDPFQFVNQDDYSSNKGLFSYTTQSHLAIKDYFFLTCSYFLSIFKTVYPRFQNIALNLVIEPRKPILKFVVFVSVEWM